MEEGGESVGKKRAEQGLRASGERYQEEKIPKVRRPKNFTKDVRVYDPSLDVLFLYDINPLCCYKPWEELHVNK